MLSTTSTYIFEKTILIAINETIKPTPHEQIRNPVFYGPAITVLIILPNQNNQCLILSGMLEIMFIK